MLTANCLYQLHLLRLDGGNPNALDFAVSCVEHFEFQSVVFDDLAPFRNSSSKFANQARDRR